MQHHVVVRQGTVSTGFGYGTRPGGALTVRNSHAEFPVVIIGAGPVGMVLALDLAGRGVGSVLVERAESSRWYPKGNTHNARTMEHYRRLGLADAVRATGLPADQPTDAAYFTRLNGHELQRLPMPSAAQKRAALADVAATDQVPEPIHRANQMYVEQVLLERVRATAAITCLFGTECLAVTADADGVEARIVPTAGGGERTLRGTYLVGCDGPRSMVRHTLGVSYQGEDAREQGFMSGLTHSTHLRIPALHKGIIRSPAWLYFMLRTDAVAGLIDLDGRDEFLFHTVGDGQLDDDALRRAVVDCVGEPVDVEILDSQDWIAGRALVAERFGEGRVFLCGDSTHLFTPTGGFGMNTGIDDAANLAWKLAALVQGWGGAGLPASYERERRPVAVRNTRAALDLANSIRDIPLSPLLECDTAEGAQARRAAGDALAGFTQEFASLGIQLGARYDGSPLLAADGTAPPPDEPATYVPTASPGGRAPHVWLSRSRSLFDALGPGFTLLRMGHATAETAALRTAAAERGIPLTLLDVSLPQARDLYERDLALIRPDHHVAWRGNTLPDPDVLLDLVTGVPGSTTETRD
jgi:2-polyprenyl-6-methoxyphenol hydroxylase-like FAD-dependent oxidoreductase